MPNPPQEVSGLIWRAWHGTWAYFLANSHPSGACLCLVTLIFAPSSSTAQWTWRYMYVHYMLTSRCLYVGMCFQFPPSLVAVNVTAHPTTQPSSGTLKPRVSSSVRAKAALRVALLVSQELLHSGDAQGFHWGLSGAPDEPATHQRTAFNNQAGILQVGERRVEYWPRVNREKEPVRPLQWKPKGAALAASRAATRDPCNPTTDTIERSSPTLLHLRYYSFSSYLSNCIPLIGHSRKWGQLSRRLKVWIPASLTDRFITSWIVPLFPGRDEMLIRSSSGNSESFCRPSSLSNCPRNIVQRLNACLNSITIDLYFLFH